MHFFVLIGFRLKMACVKILNFFLDPAENLSNELIKCMLVGVFFAYDSCDTSAKNLIPFPIPFPIPPNILESIKYSACF